MPKPTEPELPPFPDEARYAMHYWNRNYEMLQSIALIELGNEGADVGDAADPLELFTNTTASATHDSYTARDALKFFVRYAPNNPTHPLYFSHDIARRTRQYLHQLSANQFIALSKELFEDPRALNLNINREAK